MRRFPSVATVTFFFHAWRVALSPKYWTSRNTDSISSISTCLLLQGTVELSLCQISSLSSCTSCHLFFVRFLPFRLKDETDDHGIGLNDLASCSEVKMESFRLDRSESALLVIAINMIEVKTLTRNSEFV